MKHKIFLDGHSEFSLTTQTIDSCGPINGIKNNLFDIQQLIDIINTSFHTENTEHIRIKWSL